MRRLAEPRPDLRVPSPRSTSAHWAALSGCGRTRKPASANSAATRPQALDPAADEVDLVPGDEARRADVEHDRPVGAQADVVGRTPRGSGSTRSSNQGSQSGAPVRRTWSAGMRCSSTASFACRSFQTSTASGASRSRPLFVRLSQPRTGKTVRMPEPLGGAEVVRVRRADRQQVGEQQDVRAAARRGSARCAAAARGTRSSAWSAAAQRGDPGRPETCRRPARSVRVARGALRAARVRSRSSRRGSAARGSAGSRCSAAARRRARPSRSSPSPAAA